VLLPAFLSPNFPQELSMQSTHTTQPQRWSDTVLLFVLKAILIIGVLIALFAVLVATVTEQYFAPAPEIGTLFSPHYSEANFDRIESGMSEAEVLEGLGEPLNKDRMIISFNQGARSASMPTGSVTMWSYSGDNPGGIWDFAWLGRFVYFDEAGRVTGTVKWVFYD
jgi:hypothetical protein